MYTIVSIVRNSSIEALSCLIKQTTGTRVGGMIESSAKKRKLAPCSVFRSVDHLAEGRFGLEAKNLGVFSVYRGFGVFAVSSLAMS